MSLRRRLEKIAQQVRDVRAEGCEECGGPQGPHRVEIFDGREPETCGACGRTLGADGRPLDGYWPNGRPAEGVAVVLVDTPGVLDR